MTKRISEENSFVFDETRIGSDESKTKRYVENGLLEPHQECFQGQAFCTFIPFSRPNGSAPFQAYIFQESCENGHDVDKYVPARAEEGHIRDTVKRVFFRLKQDI